jgi:hypothetical protein
MAAVDGTTSSQLGTSKIPAEVVYQRGTCVLFMGERRATSV